MKKNINCTLLAGVLLCAAVGIGSCGKNAVSADTVVVFAEYNGAAGTEDDKVKAAIEEKFFADTGLKIDLQVETAGTDMIGQKIVTAMGDSSSRIDAFSCHYGSDSNLDTYILDGLTMDLTELAAEFAPAFIDTFNETNDPGRVAYNSGTVEGKLYSLSSKTRGTGWGMLIRKDYMEQTSFDPDDYDILKEGHKSLSVEEFKRLVSEMKANTAAERPVVGRPWSLDYFLTSPFGAVGYGDKVVDGEGNLIPAYADESYCKVLELYRWLQEEKLWIENPANAQNVLNYFISGKGGIYMDWPEITSQIDVARTLKEATGADCIVIEPLLKEGSATETNGNSRIDVAFSGFVVPLKAKNQELLLKYINWLYSDAENYELAQYGIEGEHWIKLEGADGTQYWGWPEGKKAEYENAAPYSGKYCLVEDYTFSDRLFADYTEEELELIRLVRAFPAYPENGCATDGMILPAVPGTDRKLRNIQTAHFNEYTSLRAYAWSDAALPVGKSIASMWQAMRDNLYDADKYFPLIQYDTENYRKVVG